MPPGRSESFVDAVWPSPKSSSLSFIPASDPGTPIMPDSFKPFPRLVDIPLAVPEAPYDETLSARVHAAVEDARRAYERARPLLDDLPDGDLHGYVVTHGQGDALLARHEELVRYVVSELHAGLHSVREAVATARGTTTRPTAWARVTADDEEE